MVSKRLCSVVFGSLLFLSATPAFADPSLADRETARGLMDAGDKKRDGGDWKGALKDYEAADALMKVPTTGLEVAKAQIQLQMLLEARETLGRVTRIPAKANEPAPFTQARKAADTLNNELSTRIPSIQVNVINAETTQAVTITIDGDTIPSVAATIPRKVNPGTHVVVVKNAGIEKKVDVKVEERESKVVPVDLKEKPPVVQQEKKDALEPKPDGGNSTGKVLMFGGFGLAIVGVGVGTVTGLMSLSKTNDLKESCPDGRCPADRQGDIDSAKSLGNISTIAFIAGGVGVGVGVIGLIMSSGDSKEKASLRDPHRVQGGLVVGPSYLGLKGAF